MQVIKCKTQARDLRASEKTTLAQRKEAVAKEKYLDQLKVKIKQ